MCILFGFAVLYTDLSEDVAGQWFIQSGLHVDELEQVEAVAMFLHHHLEEVLILKHLQHLHSK